MLNDAVSTSFLDPTLAGAFVARWCTGSGTSDEGAMFRIRDDEPAPRIGRGCTGHLELTRENKYEIALIALTLKSSIME